MILITAKVIIIGSDFSFILWFNYGLHYTNWYFNRERYVEKKENLRRNK